MSRGCYTIWATGRQKSAQRGFWMAMTGVLWHGTGSAPRPRGVIPAEAGIWLVCGSLPFGRLRAGPARG
jgi:hypothetical protein